jgi:hypothetical protein
MKVILYPGGGDFIDYENCNLVKVVHSENGKLDAIIFTDSEGFVHSVYNMAFQVIEKP